MGPNQTEKLLHSKGSHKQKEKKWQEISAHDVTDIGLQFNIEKKIPNRKNEKTKRQFLKK